MAPCHTFGQDSGNIRNYKRQVLNRFCRASGKEELFSKPARIVGHVRNPLMVCHLFVSFVLVQCNGWSFMSVSPTRLLNRIFETSTCRKHPGSEERLKIIYKKTSRFLVSCKALLERAVLNLAKMRILL